MAGDVVLITGNVLSSGLSVLINVIPGEQQILDLSSRGVELDPLTVVDLKLAAEFILRGFLFFFLGLSHRAMGLGTYLFVCRLREPLRVNTRVLEPLGNDVHASFRW